MRQPDGFNELEHVCEHVSQSLANAHPALLQRLHHAVGDAGLVLGREAQACYVQDQSGRWRGRTPVVVRPLDTAQTAAVMTICHETRTPVVPQGGNTGLAGGATPDGSGAQVVLSLARMKAIRGIDVSNHSITVEAGVRWPDVHAAAAEAGRCFPLAPGWAQGGTVGGHLAANAGGVASLRHGVLRDLVLGLEVVMPDGRVWHGLRALRRDQTGYELRQLFIGSEGTLGVITAAVLQLAPRPLARATAWVGAASVDALVTLLVRLQSDDGDRLVAFEMMSQSAFDLAPDAMAAKPPLVGAHAFHALVELAGSDADVLAGSLEQVLNRAMRDGLVQASALCGDAIQAARFWQCHRALADTQVPPGARVQHDIGLSISALADFITSADAAVAMLQPGARTICCAHLGDGSLQYSVVLPADMPHAILAHATAAVNGVVHDLAHAAGGSISSAHGIGQRRRAELPRYKSALEMELMLRIKQALDPNQLMNPGKLF